MRTTAAQLDELVKYGPSGPALLDSCVFPRGGLPARHCRAPRIGPMLPVRGSTRIRAPGRAARLLAAASLRSGAELRILATSATRQRRPPPNLAAYRGW